MKHFYLFIFTFLSISWGHSQCSTPTLSSVTASSESICSGETVTLTATTDGQQILWFNAATGGNTIGNGTSLVTAPLTSTTSFWAEARNTAVGTALSGGGKIMPSSTGGTTVVTTTSPWGLAFTAAQDFVLNSVDVFLSSSTPGNIVLQLKDQNYNVLQTITVAAPAGGTNSAPVQFTVPLNITLQAGLSYKLVVASGPAMIRDLGTNSFPYAIGTVGNITGGTINNANTNSNVYYFLYNWNYSPVVICSSARQEVAVTVINTPAPTGEQFQTYLVGETISDLEVVGENIMWYSDAAATMPLSTDTPLVNGATYYAQQTVDGCSGAVLSITVTQSLGTENHPLQHLSYYPNPVTDKLILNNAELIDTVKIYNLQGQVLCSINVKNTATQIDLSTISTGVYFVKVRSEGSSSIFRIVKR